MGKFEGNEDEDVAKILHDATMNGMVDEEVGDVTEYGMWSGIMRGVEVIDGELKDAESGGYIVQEDEYGFFSYGEYEDDEELNEEWERILATYDEIDRDIDADAELPED